MKISKIFAGMSAMALAATMLSVSASAAITNADGDNYTYDVATTIATEGLQDYFDVTDIATVKVVFDGDIIIGDNGYPNLMNEGTGAYEGFGGGIIINHAAGWDQLEWGDSPEEGKDRHLIQWNEDETEFYIEVEMTAFANPLTAEDISAEEGTWGQVCVSQWWGGDFAVASVQLLDADGNDLIEAARADAKAAREQAAADALKALQEKTEAIGVDTIVANTSTAATALTNAKEALAQIDAAIKSVADLQAAVDEAQAAFDALQEGDEADVDGLEAAKKAVEEAATKLDAAKKELSDAIKVYDAATAEQLDAKDKEIAAKDEEIKGLEAEKADLEQQLADALAQGEADAATIEELQAQIAAKDEEIAKLKADKDELEKQLDDAIKNGGSTNGGSAGDKNDDKDANPGTGAGALATVGVLLAGAAIVASKRK